MVVHAPAAQLLAHHPCQGAAAGFGNVVDAQQKLIETINVCIKSSDEMIEASKVLSSLSTEQIHEKKDVDENQA